MFRTAVIFKRFLHDRKLPSIKGYTVKDTIIKSSFESPKKANKDLTKVNIRLTIKKKNKTNVKKYGWFTNML